MSNNFFRPLFWPTVFTAVLVPIMIGLGLWQFQRLDWKTDLIQRMKTRMVEEPQPLPPPGDWASLDLKDLEYRPFTVTGHFLNGKEMHYFTQDRDTAVPGYLLITPLEIESASGKPAYVLVDRGFVPMQLADPATRPGSEPEGEVTITGFLRENERRGVFSANDEVEKNVWMVRDVQKMAKAADVKPYAPFMLQADGTVPEGTWPKPRRVHVDLPNNHFDYALTWLGLAGVLLGIYVGYHRTQGRIGRPKK